MQVQLTLMVVMVPHLQHPMGILTPQTIIILALQMVRT